MEKIQDDGNVKFFIRLREKDFEYSITIADSFYLKHHHRALGLLLVFSLASPWVVFLSKEAHEKHHESSISSIALTVRPVCLTAQRYPQACYHT